MNYTNPMTEDEARIALHKLYLKYSPMELESEWGAHHMEKIRRRGKGYWMQPEAEKYITELEREFIKS